MKNPYNLAIGADIWTSYTGGGATRYTKMQIASDTKMSWVMADGQKIPKNHKEPAFTAKGFNSRTHYFLTEQAALDARVMDLRWTIAEKIKHALWADPKAMHQIAALAGIEVKLED